MVIVPFDVAAAVSPQARARHDTFVRQGINARLPIVPVADAFAGKRFAELTINALDPHPSELANRLAAAAAAPRIANVTMSERPHCE